MIQQYTANVSVLPDMTEMRKDQAENSKCYNYKNG